MATNKKTYNEELTVTSFADLERYSKGTVVELPPFSSGHPFVARMIRPSMLYLVKSGKIPNTLLASANKLFYQNGSVNEKEIEDPALMTKMLDVIQPIIGSALLEPTLEDIERAGMELTDEQMIAIFNYTQTGVKALQNFHNK